MKLITTAELGWGGRMCLSLGVLILSLVGVEIGLRISGYAPYDSALGMRSWFLRLSDAPDLAYELIPEASGKAWGVPLVINSLGLRDQEYPPEPAEGVKRLAIVGDSVTFGNGLKVEQVFSEQLERRLKDVEVLNLGVGGYDVLDDVARLEYTGLPQKPDMALLAYCVNDVGVHSVNLQHLETKKRLSSWLHGLRIMQWFSFRTAGETAREEAEAMNSEKGFRSRFAGRIEDVNNDEFLVTKMGEVAASAQRPDEEGRLDSYLSWHADPEKVGRLRYALGRLGKTTREVGIPAVLTMLPYMEDGRRSDGWRAAREIVEYECRRADVEYIDLWGVFDDVDLKTVKLAPKDWLHPNARGHAMIADKLAEVLGPRLRGGR